jgi:hypothetical protein
MTGISEECKCALSNFVVEVSSSPLVDRGWLICVLSSPPVVVAATACSQNAANDLLLLRTCLPIGLAVAGCWQCNDGNAPLSLCIKMWEESGASGAGMHVGVSAAGELMPALHVVPRPESRLFHVNFSLAVANGNFFECRHDCLREWNCLPRL